LEIPNPKYHQWHTVLLLLKVLIPLYHVIKKKFVNRERLKRNREARNDHSVRHCKHSVAVSIPRKMGLLRHFVPRNDRKVKVIAKMFL